jgi:hypothetical protein
MERFVFVAAVTIAIIFGIGAVFGGTNGWHFEFDEDGEGGRSEIVELAPGTMEAQAFAGDRLRIRSAAANVTIIPEDRTDFLIEINNSAGQAPMPLVSTDDGRVLIDGRLRNRISDCGPDVVELRGYGDVAAADLPRITIRAPRNLDLDRSGAGTTEIGATQELTVDFSGCGDANIGDVAEALTIDLAGSGEITAGAARSLNVDLAGSGDVNVGAVAEGASVDIAGSGTVTIASLAGEFSSDGAGSGAVTVEGGAITSADVDLAGSGDVTIAAAVQSLNVSIVGSGDVDVTAAVGEVDAEIAGSGNVTVASATGTVRRQVWGSGEVRVGGRAAPATPSETAE